MEMKKFFLLSLAATLAAGTAAAQEEYVPGGVQTFRDGTDLEVVWTSLAASGQGGCRVGTGANDKFYLNDYATGVVKVYNKDGFVKDIKVADFIWVSNNADNAGHIVVRADKEAWPGSTSYPGAGDPRATAFYVIDSKTDEVISPQLSNATSLRPAGRGDAFGHINYDVTKGYWTIYHTFETQIGEILFNGTESCLGSTNFPIVIGDEFKGTNAAKGQTLGTAQAFGRYDEEWDQYLDLAVFANNYIGLTGTAGGYGCGIRHYSCTKGTDKYGDVQFTWNPEQEYFITPDHSSINGFMVFELAGTRYVIYSAGEGGGANAADAFAISEVKYADSPLSADGQREEVLVARLYPATNDAGAIKYTTKSNYMSFNIEPVEGEENSVYIYSFSQQGPMIKTKFTVDKSGVEDVIVKDEKAPVEYYNMQGIRVANPENGIFIRRQGDKATKVAL